MAETRVYRRRHPERTDYYRIVESRFEELERMWPNRKLLKRMVQSEDWAMRIYFRETLGIADGSTGGVYCVHSHGNWFNHHPHVHALVPAGIMKDGVFHELRGVSSPVIAGLFRARLLKVLLEEGVISQQIVDLLLTWNHHSGFNVHVSL